MDSIVTGSSSWRIGEVIDGRYEVLTVLGHGGMGVVHRVRHREWGTDLAVKSPRPELFRNADDRELFAAEAKVWESLGLHPNVCGCHYVRALDGIPRVFAEYVAGGSLAEWIVDRRLYAGNRQVVLARILDLAIQMAWGLEHAHSQGLVHQDVKPANVLLEVSAGGALTAKVTDFGLARARAVATSAAEHDVPAGASILVSVGGMTLAYASPEQARKDQVGRRSDIYSFAVSVLEMFTGGVTWMAGPVAGAALAAHCADPPADPDLPEFPTELAALLERCLHPEPKRRLAPMAAVAGELVEIYRQVVGQEYTQTRPVAADLRADELNNRGLSLLDLDRQDEAAEAFKAAITADPRHLEATYNDGLRQWRSGALTDEELISRLEAARTASGDPWLARYLLAEVHLERGDLTTAQELLRTVESLAPERLEVANALHMVRSGRLTDARCIKTRTMSWHEYGEARVPYPNGGRPINPPTMRIRFTADGRRALAASWKHVGLWDIRSGQCLVRLGENPPAKVDLSTDGQFALCGSGTKVRLWDLTSGRELWRAGTGKKPHASVMAVSLSADARIAAAEVGDGNVMIWDARTGRLRLRLGGHNNLFGMSPGGLVGLSLDGRFVLIEGRDGMTRLVDAGTGACVRELRGSNRAAGLPTSFRPDGRAVAMMCNFVDIGIWDLTIGRRVRTLTGHAIRIRSLSWSGDGRFLLSGAVDGTARLWEPDSGRCLRTFPFSTNWSQAMLLESDSDRAVAADEGMVRWWTLPSHYAAPPQLSRPRRHAELTRLNADVTALVDAAEQAIAVRRYTEAHGLLTKARAIRGYERAPRVLSAWRSLTDVLPRVGVRANWQVREFTGHSGSVSAVDLSPDGTRAASGDGYSPYRYHIREGIGTLRVWDTSTGRCLQEIDDHSSQLIAVRLSSDQRKVLSATFYGQLGVWSIDTGDCLMKIDCSQARGPVFAPISAHFSADGRRALTGGFDYVHFWDLDSGRCLHTITDHGGVSAVWLSPDGHHAVSGGWDDHTVRIWDVYTGECLHILAGHTGALRAVSLSPDGAFALSSGDDRTVRLWDLASGACVHVQRDLPDIPQSVRFVCDGHFVMSGNTMGAVRIWDPRTGRCLHTLDTRHNGVDSIAVTSDSRFALSGGRGATMRRATMRLWEFDWDLATSSD